MAGVNATGRSVKVRKGRGKNGNKFVAGLEEVSGLLEQLPDYVADELLMDALEGGAQIIADEAKARLEANGSVDSRMLIDHVKVRRTMPGKGRSSKVRGVAIGVEQAVRYVVRKKRGGKPVKANPSKYAHLVEFGTEHSIPRPFLRPALDAKSEQAINYVLETVNRGVEQAGEAYGAQS